MKPSGVLRMLLLGSSSCSGESRVDLGGISFEVGLPSVFKSKRSLRMASGGVEVLVPELDEHKRVAMAKFRSGKIRRRNISSL